VFKKIVYVVVIGIVLSAVAKVTASITSKVATNLEMEAAGIPSCPPPENLSDMPRERTAELGGGNPFGYEESSGKLVAKDPKMRQAGEDAATYRSINEIANLIDRAVPLLMIVAIAVLLCRRQGAAAQQPADGLLGSESSMERLQVNTIVPRGEP